MHMNHMPKQRSFFTHKWKYNNVGGMLLIFLPCLNTIICETLMHITWGGLSVYSPAQELTQLFQFLSMILKLQGQSTEGEPCSSFFRWGHLQCPKHCLLESPGSRGDEDRALSGSVGLLEHTGTGLGDPHCLVHFCSASGSGLFRGS